MSLQETDRKRAGERSVLPFYGVLSANDEEVRVGANMDLAPEPVRSFVTCIAAAAVECVFRTGICAEYCLPFPLGPCNFLRTKRTRMRVQQADKLARQE